MHGRLLDKDGRSSEAIEKFRIATNILPNTSKIKYNYAICAYRQGLYLESIDALRLAINAEADNKAPMLYLLGIILCENLNNQNEGMPYLLQALKTNPSHNLAEAEKKVINRSR